MTLKKIVLLFVLIAGIVAAFYLYVDTNKPVISWGAEDKSSINHALKVVMTDDVSLKEVCFTVTGGNCSGKETCSGPLDSQSFDLLIQPDQCAVSSEPMQMKITVNAVDSSLIANKVSSSIELVYDSQAPTLATLQGSHSLKRGGAGVVLYEVGEVPRETGIVLDDLFFKAFRLEPGKYLSFYAHPYYMKADDFKPRVFAVDEAGNTRKIRPGSRTASQSYRSETLELTDDFLESVKDKMMASSPQSPLEVFSEINSKVRQENQQKITQICQQTEARKLWQGVFLRNQGATKAGFADSRTYKYRSDVVSRTVHTGIDIAGVNNTEIFAANHGKVIFVGEIGIYGNVVVLDHGYGLHSLYGHLHKAHVQVGESVEKGDVIAVSGETGLVFGDHLHYEMRINGIPVNPIEWFDNVWVQSNIEAFMP